MHKFSLLFVALLSIGCVLAIEPEETSMENFVEGVLTTDDMEGLGDLLNIDEMDEEDNEDEMDDEDTEDEDDEEDNEEEQDESAWEGLINNENALQLLQTSMSCSSCTRRRRNCMPCKHIRAAVLHCRRPVKHRRVRSPLLNCNAIARLRGAITKRYARKTKRLATLFMHMRTRLRALGQLNARMSTTNVVRSMLHLFRTKKFQFNWMNPGKRMRNRVNWHKGRRGSKEHQIRKILKMLGAPILDENGNVVGGKKTQVRRKKPAAGPRPVARKIVARRRKQPAAGPRPAKRKLWTPPKPQKVAPKPKKVAPKPPKTLWTPPRVSYTTFRRMSLQGQILAEAACTAINNGGWTFAVKRQCGGVTPSCDEVCNRMTESQAGGLRCVNALHIYGNQPTNAVSTVGLKVHRYNSCAGNGCGPNYCCCTQRSFEETADVEEDSSDEDAEGDEDEEEDEEEPVQDLEMGAVPYTGFSPSKLPAQIMAQATCVALNARGGWTFAVQRTCGGFIGCDTVCARLRESQAGGLESFNALHLYGNVDTNNVHTVGLKTYKYNSASAAGCGPNYCCCRNSGRGEEEQEEQENLEMKAPSAEEIEQIEESSDLNTFEQNSMDGQIQAEAACVALAPAASNKAGWTYAIRRDCSHTALSCDELCRSSNESQARSAGNSNLHCINALHIYANQPFNGVSQVGLKTYRYNNCGGRYCGPNYCCCWAGYNNQRP